MDLINSYSSDEEETELRLPAVPDSITNKYSKKPKLSVNKSTKMTSFVYYNWKLSNSQLEKLSSILDGIGHVKSLVRNETFKIVNDLHISLSLNFKIELQDVDKLVKLVDQFPKRKISVQFEDRFGTLESATTDKSFLVMNVKPNAALSSFIKLLNNAISGFDPSYTGYDANMVHCSIAEIDKGQKAGNTIVSGAEDFTLEIDKISITKGRAVEVVYTV